MLRYVMVLAFAFAVSATSVAHGETAAPTPSCALDDAEDRTVVRVIDGETLMLEGGSELKLVGALAPRAFDAAGEASAWPLADQARLTLERIAGGRGIRVAYSGRRLDRYGRLLGHVFLGGADGAWLQGEMLKRGLARAYALEGSTACLADLIAHEAVAREAAIGLWSEPVYAVRSSDDTRGLLRLAGTYQIVEGRVTAVSDVRGSLFVNFGEDWRQDFTAVLRAAPRRQGRGPEHAALAELKGQRIRVRGWIERRGGPMVELPHVAAVEVLASTPDEPSAKSARDSRRRARVRRQAGQPSPGE